MSAIDGVARRARTPGPAGTVPTHRDGREWARARAAFVPVEASGCSGRDENDAVEAQAAGGRRRGSSRGVVQDAEAVGGNEKHGVAAERARRGPR